ncbi:MAG: hypothetical protein ACRC4W_06970 [Treponemataceae bacterium]
MFIPIIGLCILTVILAFHKLNTKKNAEKYSRCLLAFPTKPSKTTVVIIIMSYFIHFALFVKDFSILQSTVLVIVSLFAVYTALKDSIYWKYSGIYADFILLHGKKINKLDIAAFANLNVEQNSVQNTTEQGLSKKNNEFFLTFDNPEQCQSAITVLQNWL